MPKTSKKIDPELSSAIREYKPELTDSSVRIYSLNLMHLASYYDKPLSPELFKNPKEIREDLEELKYSTPTLKNKIVSIITYLRMKTQPESLISQYTDYYDMLAGKMSKHNATMDKTTKEKDNWMTKDDLIKYLDILKKELPTIIKSKMDLSRWMRYITLLIHIDYPFRNELADTQIVSKLTKNDPDVNYIIADKKNNNVKAIIQNYKTKKTYKDIKLNFIPSVAKDVLTYYKLLSNYKKLNNINNDWFLLAKNNEKMTRNDFTFFIKSIFEPLGKNISTTMIRKIIVSSLYPVEKMKELAHIMGHSVQLAVNNYAKD
jgi:hypothetical protein